jgi:glutamine amidotransferase
MKIGIIDIGTGNLKSIQNMFGRIGYSSGFVRDASILKNCEKIVLPGMGSFDKCMEALNGSGLREELEIQTRLFKKPFLGICVGLQMLMRSSHEGKETGLNWIDGETVPFDTARMEENQKIPHMGWQDIEIVNQNPLSMNLVCSRFYFAHSYHVKLDMEQDEWIRARYSYSFTAAVKRDNIYGVQFHPEKSHRFGTQLLKSFAELDGCIE